MKKLLLNNLFVVMTITFFSCSNTKNNLEHKKVEINKSHIADTVNLNYKKGDTISPRSTNNKTSKKKNNFKEVVIKHNSPNQNQIDSIKKAKTKEKK